MIFKQFHLTFFVMIGVMGGMMPLHSYGQSSHYSLNKRLDIMEKELKAVQRKVFTPGSEFPQPRSNIQSGSRITTSPQTKMGSGAPIADIEVRLSQVETEIRQLTGRVEEGNFETNRLKQSLETMARDYEFRLKELEKNSATNRNVTAQNSPEASVAILPAGSQQEQYSYAQKLVTMGQYDKAGGALSEFIKRYPKSQLAGNAQYWLGQTYYVRKIYAKAIRAFLEGYNNYPKHRKAPAFLLKIGMSLFAMGEKTDACDAYRELSTRFPDSLENKNRRLAEEKRAGCR